MLCLLLLLLGCEGVLEELLGGGVDCCWGWGRGAPWLPACPLPVSASWLWLSEPGGCPGAPDDCSLLLLSWAPLSQLGAGAGGLCMPPLGRLGLGMGGRSWSARTGVAWGTWLTDILGSNVEPLGSVVSG